MFSCLLFLSPAIFFQFQSRDHLMLQEQGMHLHFYTWGK